MFLSDSHIHTNISPDGADSMADMARASAAAGVSYVCFTDHSDTVDWKTLRVSEAATCVFPEMLARYRAMAEKGEIPQGLELRLGLEVGEAHMAPELALRCAAQPGLDLVIGSVHILPDQGDFYFIDYRDEAHCLKLFDDYMDRLREVAEMDFFDVCGHIGYPCRYIRQAGFDVDILSSRYLDKLRQLLSTLIQNGRGIELNCSGTGTPRGPFPVPGVLRLYRELGGEILTLGSDAHCAKQAGRFLREGMELLSGLGFKYTTVFRGRKPFFEKI